MLSHGVISLDFEPVNCSGRSVRSHRARPFSLTVVRPTHEWLTLHMYCEVEHAHVRVLPSARRTSGFRSALKGASRDGDVIGSRCSIVRPVRTRSLDGASKVASRPVRIDPGRPACSASAAKRTPAEARPVPRRWERSRRTTCRPHRLHWAFRLKRQVDASGPCAAPPVAQDLSPHFHRRTCCRDRRNPTALTSWSSSAATCSPSMANPLRVHADAAM